MEIFERECLVPGSAAEVYAWHARPGAFERLAPPWAPPRLIRRSAPGVAPGVRLVFRTPLGPFSIVWEALHEACVPGVSFQDRQIRGPFASWTHRHLFEDAGPGCCRVRDRVEYALPGGAAGRLAAGGRVRRELARLFAHRHRSLRADLERHAAYAARPRLTVALTGASGLVGRRLSAFLTAGGHRVIALVRRPAAGPDEAFWEPQTGEIDAARVEGIDAAVHLAGENLAAARWTPSFKRRILESRALPTRLLCARLAAMRRPPSVLLSASAVGWYGHRASGESAESDPPGGGFLAEVCREWEAATEPARQAGIRTVRARIGTVIAGDGGALARMLPAFRLGLGGPIGPGTQGVSWIALEDLVGALHHLLRAAQIAGPVNLTAPRPVAQGEFARVLGRVLHRPAVLPLPAQAVGMLFGEMGRTLLLEGCRAVPRRLAESGFEFLYPGLEQALRRELGREEAE